MSTIRFFLKNNGLMNKAKEKNQYKTVGFHLMNNSSLRIKVAPPKTAIIKLPVTVISAKPEIAPMIIIPSTPRFRTPDLSVINSPQDAKIKGTAEAIIDVIISPTKFISTIIFLYL